jgi:hypothetical protein
MTDMTELWSRQTNDRSGPRNGICRVCDRFKEPVLNTGRCRECEAKANRES